jgi:hypothetical protein
MKLAFRLDKMSTAVYGLNAAKNKQYLELEKRKRDLMQELFALMKADGDI